MKTSTRTAGGASGTRQGKGRSSSASQDKSPRSGSGSRKSDTAASSGNAKSRQAGRNGVQGSAAGASRNSRSGSTGNSGTSRVFAPASGNGKSQASGKSGTAKTGATRNARSQSSGGGATGRVSGSGNGRNRQSENSRSGSAVSKVKELDDLFEDGLKDMYWVEKALTRALPRMMAKATNPTLKAGLQVHLKETQTQLVRLEKVFAAVGMKPKTKPCAAMQGILEEGNEIVKETATGAVRDAGIIASCQKVEYYEITSYGTLRAFAQELGHGGSVINLLSESLEEEKEADKKLTEIAEGGINRQADAD